MKVSIQQLDAVISKLKYSLLGYSEANKQDLEVTIELVTADPGSGKMVDYLKLTATQPTKPKDAGGLDNDVERTMVVEIYPYADKESPRASKIESFKVDSKY